MSSPHHWFRGAQLVALVLSLATPGCLADGDDVDADPTFAPTDQGIDVGLDYDLIDEPALELMAEGHAQDRERWQDPSLDDRLGGGIGTDSQLLGHEGEEEGEPTPQPWQNQATDDPGDEGGPDPVPWDVADLGPDPVPWHNDDDLTASTGGQTQGREGYDPN